MPQLEITLRGALLVAGGQAPGWGADLATARAWREGGWVPYIPATALRGAVRIQLEALLVGAGRRATGPYPFDDGSPPAVPDAVVTLFGHSGPEGERMGSREGCVRFGDALPRDPERARRVFRLRPGVAIERRTGTADDKKLFFREVAELGTDPLVFVAEIDTGGASSELVEVLQAAAESTTSIGAAKGTGGGDVEIRWREDSQPRGAVVRGEPTGAARARVALNLLEPAHFGDGGPRRNHHGTRNHLPGATLRGAIAWALLRQGRASAEDPAFEALFLGPEAAGFGDGLLLAEGAQEPLIQPLTRVERRVQGGREVLDLLVRELARERVNQALEGTGAVLRADDGPVKLHALPARPGAELLRRTRTRVSIDRRTGTARDRRLFSIEQIESHVPRADGSTRQVRLQATVEGLEQAGPDAARLLAGLAGVQLLVGGGRQHGLGKVEVELSFEAADPEAEVQAALAQVEALASALDAELATLAARAGLESPLRLGAARRHLALVAAADYLPGTEGGHPLGELGAAEAGEPVRCFLAHSRQGGYDQAPHSEDERRQAPPLKTLRPALAAGSVFVYELAEGEVEPLLRRLLPGLARGVGRNVESGCGRFRLWEPWVAQEHEPEGQRRHEMRAELAAEVKAELVRDAVRIVGRIDRGGGKEATSQLRNLVQITQTEGEVEVLKNFLRYQAGRSATKALWQGILDDTCTVLDKIPRDARIGTNEQRRVAIQSFFGYMVREYVYKTGAQGAPRQQAGPRGPQPGPHHPGGRPRS